MKKYETPWSNGSMFICNKCGIAFGQPDMAEKLKTDLRSHLKSIDAHKKVRVMVSGCLNICIKEEQAVMFQSVQGPTEVFTIGKNFEANSAELKSIISAKIK